MKHIKLNSPSLSILALLFFMACNKSETNEGFVTPPTTTNEAVMLQLVNAYRSKGCNCGDEYFDATTPLTWNDTLELAAYNHSTDMNSKNFFDHKGSDGSMANNRIEKYNYNWTAYGENIASGYQTESEVVEAWIKSPGHCKNIMNPNFEEIGVARAGDYWTQVFGAQ